LLTQERHRFAIARALDEVRAFRGAWGSGEVPAPVAAVHLREGVTPLEDLIGAGGGGGVLDEGVRRFCVGKELSSRARGTSRGIPVRTETPRLASLARDDS